MKTKLCVILTAGLLAACSSDSDNPTPPQNRPIYVEVSERPMIPEGAEARELDMGTRAVATTTASLAEFTMHNGSNEYEAKKKESDNTWTVTGYWPTGAGNNDKIPFYAHTVGASGVQTYNVNGDDPYINFTVHEDGFTQHDLLVAKTTASYIDHDSGNVGKIHLTFDHACAAVKFNVFITNTLAGKISNGTLTVTSIVLRDVKNTGRYYFNSGWKNVSGSNYKYFTLTNGPISVSTTPTDLPCGCIFMIPQSCSGAYLEVNFSGQTKTSVNIPLTGSWEAGKEYTVNIKLGTKSILE